MSHEITNVNGRNEMAYVGEKPWHGLGQELQRGASIEKWIIAAGMDWKVLRSKVRYVTGVDSGLREWPEQHVLFRSDTKAPLGMVSDHYKVVQPREVLEFFRDLAESNDFALETAGTLRGGRIYWALASINEQAMVGRGDKMRGHVLFSTSADGSRNSETKNVATRVVCANTMAAADAETGKACVRVSHRSVFNAEAVKQDLGIARGAFHKFMEQARALAARKIVTSDVEHYLVDLLGGETHAATYEAKAAEITAGRHAKEIIARFAGNGMGATLDSSRGTVWGLVNAVTEYVDHAYPARSRDNRLVSAWFGNGANLKSKAMALAMDLV